MKFRNIILNSVFIAARCLLSACTKTILPPAISSCWQVSGLTEDGWIEYINKPITDTRTPGFRCYRQIFEAY